MEDHLSHFAQCLGPTGVVRDADLMEAHARDWSAGPAQLPAAVLKPSTAEEVSAVLAYANENAIAIVVQGGRTGLAGGAVPKPGEIALSLERMNRIIDIDTVAMTMTVEAGATLQQVQEAADAAGLLFPLDLGGRGSCMVGGNAATNAGGNRVLKYGTMRALVLGLEAVLPTGERVGGMNAMIKNNAGFDLKYLFIGTEGTMGVITQLVLKLAPKPAAQVVTLCAASSFSAMASLLAQLRSRAPGAVSAFEVMWADYFTRVAKTISPDRPPFAGAHEFYAIVEFEGEDRDALMAQVEALFADALEKGTVQDVIIGQSLQHDKDIWAIRDGIGDLMLEIKPCIAFDIALPLPKIKDFVDAARAMAAEKYSDTEYFAFGHLGDNNVHVAIGGGKEEDVDAIEGDVLKLAGTMNGSISGEHGIGVLKKNYLDCSRSAADIAMMRTLKAALDPKNILNPGRVVDI